MTIKSVDKWMKNADGQVNDSLSKSLESRLPNLKHFQLSNIKNESDKMTPEDRVSYTMELQEDVAAKVEIIKKAIATESELLPQGNFKLHF